MNLKALKIAAIISAAVVPLSIFVPADAKNVTDNGDFRYVVSADGKTAEIVSYVGKSLYVSIPSALGDCEVTSIGAAAFKDNDQLKEIDISGSIKSIDMAAFSGCTSLSKVHISGTVNAIGESAFSGCSSLSELSIDDGLQTIGKYAFSECTALKTAVIPNSVDNIGDYAFLNCTALESPQIPKSLRYFGGYALENTKWMKSQKGDFVIVGDGLLIKYIGDSDIKSIPDKVKTIGSYSFAGNKFIKNVMIPSTVNVIENSAFEGCENLDDVYMPASVERIGQRAFYGCSSLKNIDLTERLSLIDSYCFSFSGLETVKITKNVSVINKGAFENCTSLTDVSLGSGVKKIGEAAFKNCTSLKRFVFPANVSEVEKDAFAGCTNLLRVEFNGDTKLHEFAFSELPHLNAAVFYKNPKTIEDNAFNQSPELIMYSENNMYIDEYAKQNGKKSENIKNLPQFNEYIKDDQSNEDNQQFSVGYTLITILIIIIDIAVIGYFVLYIIVIDPKRMKAKAKRRNEDYVYVKHNPRRNSSGKISGSKKSHSSVGNAAQAERTGSRSRPAKPVQSQHTRTYEKAVNTDNGEEIVFAGRIERKNHPVQGKSLYGSEAAGNIRKKVSKEQTGSPDANKNSSKSNRHSVNSNYDDTKIYRKHK